MSELQFNLPESYNTANNYIDTYIKSNKTPKISAEELNTTLKSSVDVFTDVYTDINTLATTVSGLQAKDYLTIKGSLPSVDALPATDNKIGDLYFINTDEYIWSGTEWVCLGPLITVPAYTVRIIIPPGKLNPATSYTGWSSFNISDTDIEKFKTGEVTTVIVDDQTNNIKGVASAAFYQLQTSSSFTSDVISFSLPCSSNNDPTKITLRCYTMHRFWDPKNEPVKLIWTDNKLV